MVFGLIKRWRRRKLQRDSITYEERNRLQHSLWQHDFLTTSEQEQLIRWMRIFIHEKYWEGCEGLSVTDEMKFKVAAQAGLMVLANDGWYFDRTQTILIYPRPYIARTPSVSLGPSMGWEGEIMRAGETAYLKPVIVNWNDVQLGARDENDGNNIVIHEFAHQLDLINGPSADGLPPLPPEIDEHQWWEAMKAELEAAQELVENGYRVLINDYGLGSAAEFFAVASELYFQSPYKLAEFHPNVFDLLRKFYQIDMRRMG